MTLFWEGKVQPQTSSWSFLGSGLEGSSAHC